MKQVVFITGTSSGFGDLMVKAVAPAGHTVYATMRNIEGSNKEKADALRTWADENQYDVHILEVDVTSNEQVKQAIDTVIAEQGKIDVVVNNAGIGNYGVTEGYSEKQLQHIFDVNVHGSMRVVHAALPKMREQKSGAIVQISSMLGRTVIPFMTPYCATKFAVEALCEGLSDELSSTGVDVCIIQPGGYPTDFAARLQQPETDLHTAYGEIAQKSAASMEHFGEMMQSNQAPDPQDVADALLKIVEGDRPKRTICGATIPGIAEINTLCEKTQEQLLQGFGLR